MDVIRVTTRVATTAAATVTGVSKGIVAAIVRDMHDYRAMPNADTTRQIKTRSGPGTSAASRQ